MQQSATVIGLPQMVADQEARIDLASWIRPSCSHGKGLVPGEDHGLKPLVGLVVGGPGLEIFAEVKEHSLGHDARRDEPVANAGDAAGPVAGFLGKLALGGLVGRLALVDGARREPPAGSRRRHGDHFLTRQTWFVVNHGNQGNGTAVDDHLALGRWSRRPAPPVCRARSIFKPRKITRRDWLRAGLTARRSGSSSVAGVTRSGIADGQDGAGRLTDDPLGHRAEKDVAEARPAVSGDDDQVDLLFAARSRRWPRPGFPTAPP